MQNNRSSSSRMTSGSTMLLFFFILFLSIIATTTTILAASAANNKNNYQQVNYRRNYKSTNEDTINNRAVYAFGSNVYGQLGQKDYSIPQQIDSFQGKTVTNMCTSFDTFSQVRVFFTISSNGENAIYGFGTVGNDKASLLGLNKTGTFTTPQLIKSFSSPIKSLACGNRHVLMVLENKEIYGFGENEYGQLSNTLNSMVVPTLLPAITGANNVFAVGDTSFLVDDSNALYAWGNNDFNKMGLATITNPVLTPTLLSGANTGNVYNNNVKKVVGYDRSVFVLTTDNKLYASGFNDRGVLGVNTTTTQIATPTLVPVISNVKEISIFKKGVLATNGNELYFWGFNEQLNLCHTDNLNEYILPTLLTNINPALPTIGNIQSISISQQHTLLLTDQNRIYVCGDNSEGQLGIQPFQTRVDTATNFGTSNIPVGRTVKSILTTSTKNSFLLTSEGLCYSMGKIDGAGNQVYYPNPVKVNNIPSNIEHVYAGYYINFATQYKTGTTLGWGKNRSPYNILNPTLPLDQFTPRIIPELAQKNISKISMGATYIDADLFMNIIFLQNDSLAIYGLGSNRYGNFGDNKPTSTIYKTVTMVQFDNGTTLINDISAGGIHTLLQARRKNDYPATSTIWDMFILGGNTKGQIGLPDFTATRTIPLRSRSNVAKVVANQLHSFYLSVEQQGGGGSGPVSYYNKPWASGNNDVGQLGLSALFVSSTFRYVGGVDPNQPGVFDGILNIKTIYTGSTATFIILNNGTVYVSGDNTYGQLGLNPSIYGTQIRNPIINPNIPNNILKMSVAGTEGAHTILLTTEGKVYVFGRNTEGQLGLGHFNNVWQPTLLTFPGNEIALDVSAGTDHTLVLTGTRTCPGNCNYKGKCDQVTGLCACYTTFTGYDCSLYDCDDPKCNGHGTCDTSIGICTCDGEWTGISCELRKCPNNCNGHGTCNSKTGQCDCDAGFQTTIDCSNPDAASSLFSLRQLISILLFISFCYHAFHALIM
ncbi:hypothetical protein ABK040_001306 [Willaertia magna]